MATPDILDFGKLLSPIPGGNPAGANLREDISPKSVYQAIKAARGKARAAERKQNEGDRESVADWSPLLDLVPDVIAEKSKDLELAAWLIEALLRRHGFAGLRDGFRLARELVEGFWDGLYPLPDEEGVLSRVAALAGLNGIDGAEGTLIGPIQNVPLTDEAAAEGPFARWHYRQAADLEAITDPEKREKRVQSGAVSRRTIEKAEASSSPEFIRNLFEDLSGCIQEFDRISALLDERCGKDADGRPLSPPASTIRTALKECLDIAEGNAKARAPALADAPGQAEGGGSAGGSASRPGAGSMRSRDEAFRALLEVARFFRDTEPHSPVSYALERAVKWGRMPLPELLTELIAEEGSRSSVFKLVGIQQPVAEPPPS